MERPVYLDYNATTPVDPRVLEAMLPWFTGQFGNAASSHHVFGWEAAAAVEEARRHIAHLIGAHEKELVFTSGATEANNLALKGLAEASPEKRHFITVKTEHKAILDVCAWLEAQGRAVTYLDTDSEGLLHPDQVAEALRPDTLAVSVMWANNETGVIQPLREIGAICRKAGVWFHTDATQAVGKLSVYAPAEQVDLLSFSAHKLYGPKGIGALYVRKGVPLSLQMHGGGHERGRRSGTLNVPGIIGFGKACELAGSLPDSPRLSALRDELEQGLLASADGVQVNGSAVHRLPNVTNLSFPEVDGEELLLQLSRIAVSNGSACTSASVLPSHVLKAMGVSDERAHASVRFSLGRFTTPEDIRFTIRYVAGIVSELRRTR